MLIRNSVPHESDVRYKGTEAGKALECWRSAEQSRVAEVFRKGREHQSRFGKIAGMTHTAPWCSGVCSQRRSH